MNKIMIIFILFMSGCGSAETHMPAVSTSQSVPSGTKVEICGADFYERDGLVYNSSDHVVTNGSYNTCGDGFLAKCGYTVLDGAISEQPVSCDEGF